MSNESFIELFGTDDLSLVPLHYFVDFRKFCAQHEQNSLEFIERIDEGALQRFSLGLLETALRQFEDLEGITAHSVRRMTILLSTLYNASARSQRFRKTVEKHNVLHYMTLLRIEPIRTETLACLSILARELHKAFFLDDSYNQLLTDLVNLWNFSPRDDQRAWISTFFASLLEDDYGFLSECYASLEKNAFTDLLTVVETLLDKTSTGKEIKIHPNNLSFCLDLFERIDFELLNASMSFNSSDTCNKICLLTDIFASAALQRPLYDDCFHKDQRCMRLICGMLKSILEAETTAVAPVNHSPSLPMSSSRKRNMSVDPDENSIANDFSGDQTIQNGRESANHVSSINSMQTFEVSDHQLQSSAPERQDNKPPDPKCARRELDEPFKSSAQLQKLIKNRRISTQIVANIKQAAVRCIGNLCFENPQNRLASAEMDAVYFVVHCGRRNENDRPFIVQWAISSLKQLCLNCPENQEKLLELHKRPNFAINLDRLLQSLGLKKVWDEVTETWKLEKSED